MYCVFYVLVYMNTHSFVVTFSSSIKKTKSLKKKKETNLQLLWSICVFSEEEHLLLHFLTLAVFSGFFCF